MASLQSNSTFSFKHHLTGEACPACRAILPLHSNTTCDRRGMLGMVSVYLRTSTIAKNRHLNIASGTVSKNRHLRSAEKHRTGTCTGYGDTFGPALARKNTKPWRSTPIHVSPATMTIQLMSTIWMIDPTGRGKVS